MHSSKFDMNVIGAWKKGYTGKNVVVTILDDGIERDHPDLVHNYVRMSRLPSQDTTVKQKLSCIHSFSI